MPDVRKLLLKNHLSPGDVLCMTSAIYSLHKMHPGRFEVAVETSCPAVWEHNPDVVAKGDGFEAVQTHYPLIDQCNQRAVHVLQGYCDFLANFLGVQVPLLTNRPHLYLSSQELSWMSQVQEKVGRQTKFWLVNAGTKQDYTTKQWPWFQEVVDKLQGRVQFVQVGKSEHLHKPLRGVINLLGMTDDRQLVRLVHHAEGVLCGVTFLMHLAAAFQKPAVVLAGGREPRSWNTYPRQVLLNNVGALPCCRMTACWKSRTVRLEDGGEQNNSLCENPVFTEPVSPRCMAMIEAESVCKEISNFYTGGVLVP